MRVTINTKSVRACVLAKFGKCTKGPLHRHHTGNDGWLKFYHPAIQRQYQLFLDCEDVCDYHHMAVHYLYELSGLHDLSSIANKGFKGIMERRTEFIVYFQKIKSGEVKLKRVPKLFRDQWKASRKKWQTRSPQT